LRDPPVNLDLVERSSRRRHVRGEQRQRAAHPGEPSRDLDRGMAEIKRFYASVRRRNADQFEPG
jgi:hypothetical protein